MPSNRAQLELEGVSKSYGRRVVLDDVSFSVSEGERFFIAGPSGCGKTTILRIVAGLIKDHRGAVRIDGRTMAGNGPFVPPHRRDVGVVFQDGALWPHLTIEKHLYFSRKARADREWTERIFELTGLASRRGDYPHELSGGEGQRIALARALSGRPRLLLLDEPLRNLDRGLARELRRSMVEILDRLGTTALFVTHDLEEALSMADRILVMDAAGIVQIGTPRQIYAAPAAHRVLRFFGEVTTFEGRADACGALATPFGPVATGLPPGTPCRVCYRPEQIRIVPAGSGSQATVVQTAYLGSSTHVAAVAGGVIITAACGDPPPAPGESVGLEPKAPPIVFTDAPQPAGEARHEA